MLHFRQPRTLVVSYNQQPSVELVFLEHNCQKFKDFRIAKEKY